MKNNKKIEEIHSLLSVLNDKIQHLDEKNNKPLPKKSHKSINPLKKDKSKTKPKNIQNMPEQPIFGTKIFKNPDLIFKNIHEKDENQIKLPKIDKENSRVPIKNLNKMKFIIKKEYNNEEFHKNESLDDVENRIKDLHLRSENALLRFVEIRQDLIKSKENPGNKK